MKPELGKRWYTRGFLGASALLAATPTAALAAQAPEPVSPGASPRQPELTSAAPESRERVAEREPSKRAGDEVQRLDYVESAYGSSPRTVFAGVSGTAISSSEERAQLGLLLGGSPLPRLTLHGMVGRDGKGHFAPWLAAQYAFWGGGPERHALGALVQYKTEGFTEAGGELELGALFSLRPGRFQLDLAAIFGIGLEEDEKEEKAPGKDDGEADAEGKLRFAYRIFEPLRAGVIGRFRQRVVGERSLAGGKSWDFIGGAELVASLGPCAISASGGPTTLGVAGGVGAYGLLSVALFSGL